MIMIVRMGLPGPWYENELVIDYRSEARGLPFLVSHMHRTRETRCEGPMNASLSLKMPKLQALAQDIVR
jgi:hypothetical protein